MPDTVAVTARASCSECKWSVHTDHLSRLHPLDVRPGSHQLQLHALVSSLVRIATCWSGRESNALKSSANLISLFTIPAPLTGQSPVSHVVWQLDNGLYLGTDIDQPESSSESFDQLEIVNNLWSGLALASWAHNQGGGRWIISDIVTLSCKTQASMLHQHRQTLGPLGFHLGSMAVDIISHD